MMQYLRNIVFLFIFTNQIVALRKQGVAVRGQLLCGTEPAQRTKVRIVDIDTGLFSVTVRIFNDK